MFFVDLYIFVDEFVLYGFEVWVVELVLLCEVVIVCFEVVVRVYIDEGEM